MPSPATTPYTLNIDGQLLSLERPQVMGIVNATAESFYHASRALSPEAIAQRALTLLHEGATLLDVGGCSTKPGLAPVSEEEEIRRLSIALAAIREAAPHAILSVDTFRASVAERCVREYGVQIINDVSGGRADEHMFSIVASLGVPYILTYTGDSQWQHTTFELASRIHALHLLGVNDVIVDPGFGFGKSIDDNYRLMAHLEELHMLECPLLVGISRKSMIYKHLHITPAESLNGTTALHTVALMKGAHILRVHDVKAAVEAVAITEKLKDSSVKSHNS